MQITLKYAKFKPDRDPRSVWTDKSIQVNEVLQKMYEDHAVYDAAGKKIKYTSGVGPVEGWNLYNLAKLNGFRNVLEVGCAYGTSALYICEALREGSGKLVSIDPFQSTQWKGIGQLNIKRAGLEKNHEVIEKTSDIAMAELLAAGHKFDMIFVDGMHLFDYTVLDIYFAAKLCRIGGAILVDDIRRAGVKKAMEYVKKNYTFLKLVPDHAAKETMGLFEKVGEDDREWFFHNDF